MLCFIIFGCDNQINIWINANAPKIIVLDDDENAKLSYLLQWVLDFNNSQENTEIQPLATDESKWIFIYNILNDNYMNKYEFEESANDGQPYPNLEDAISLKKIDGCSHDWIMVDDELVQVVFKKSTVDQILNDIVWATISDWWILKEWLILDWDNYLFFNYKYYWSELILNRWRWTQFTINEMNQISENIFEITATYVDDAIEWECSLLYKAEKNDNSFYWYTIKSYEYSGCDLNTKFVNSDFPTQLVYGISDWIYSDQQSISQWEVENIFKDLNNDWIEENFIISRDKPNWTKLIWIIWDKWTNFIYDFTSEVTDEYDELLPWLSAEMYFEDFDSDGIIEVLVAIWDRKNFVEWIIYKKNWNNFEKLWDLHWKWYIEFVPYTEDPDYRWRWPEYAFHLPYSTSDWKCNVVNMYWESIYDMEDTEECNDEYENEEIMNSTTQQCYECWDKPVIYLYPQETTNVSVKLDFKWNLLATYPVYNNSIKWWNVIANPDWTLTDLNWNEYSYLFREWKFADTDRDFSKWFVVKWEDTIEFLQNTLAKIWLTPREYNEFIVYRYPKMKNNKYNMIYFAQEEYTDRAQLTINPTPDSILRVFMVYKPLNEYVKITEQKIIPFDRTWFTVVEWWGSEAK